MAKTKKTAVEITTHTPEVPVDPTFESQEAERVQARLKMLAASCEVEIDRIRKENGVRIGNSVINEAFAMDEITKALEKIQTKYLSLC